MGRVSVAVRRRLSFATRAADAGLSTPCHAPFGQLFLDPVGDVSTCCLADGHVLGNIAEQRLPDIWHGARLAQVRQAMLDHDFSLGCRGCERIVVAGLPGRERAYDVLAPSTSMTPRYPKRLEINTSNACNLQCVMCSGLYSSAIRIHREQLPPLPKVYDEQFFADLAEFIPHLQEASFTGGEPFLAPEYGRIWALMAELNPDMTVHVTTNATTWNARVERILSSLRFNVNVSLDGATKATYERVRVGAVWEEVRENVDRFLAYTRRAGTVLSIFHCLLAENYDEFGELLLLGDQLDVDVHVHTVVGPASSTLEQGADWDGVVASFERQAREIRPRLGRNAPVFDVHHRRVVDGALREAARSVMGLSPIGRAGFDEDEVGRELGVDLAGYLDFRLVVDLEGRLLEVAAAPAEPIGATADEMVGWTLEDFDTALAAVLGPRALVAVEAASEEHLRQELAFGDTHFDVVLAAERDAKGVLTDLRLYGKRLP